jgi:magnesium transporter
MGKKIYPERRQRKGSKKAGLAPGTIAYVGDTPQFDAVIDIIEYDEKSVSFKAGVDVSEIDSPEKLERLRWINITGIHDVSLIEKIGKIMNLHSLVLEDIAHANQRAKLDEFDDYIYVAAQMITYDSEVHQINTEQLSIVLHGNTLISFQEKPGDLFNDIRERIQQNIGKLRRSGLDYLLYALLDTIVDHYFTVIEKIGDDLDSFESHLLEGKLGIKIHELHSLKRELVHLRKAVWPMRELIGLISKSNTIQAQSNTVVYFRDVYDHCVRAIETLESYREMSSGLVDMYHSFISNKMNNVMKTLTIISTIFIPLTFIVGVYGMNFQHMPELATSYGYPTVWAIMIILSLGMIVYFKQKDWF